MITEIFVRLVNEDVVVWRPVRADHLFGDVYLIDEQPYDRSVETWEYEPGQRVVCGIVEADDGSILAATRPAAP